MGCVNIFASIKPTFMLACLFFRCWQKTENWKLHKTYWIYIVPKSTTPSNPQ